MRDDQGRSFWPEAAAGAAIHDLYHDCPRPAAEAAFARLRHQARLPSTEPCPLESLPAVRTVSVIATGDRSISPAWSRVAARERLGVEPVELAGGHSPFLARPDELADRLLECI